MDLIDAQKQTEGFAGYTVLPSKSELNGLVTGQFVRLCHNGSFFWARVVSLKGRDIHCTADDTLPAIRRGEALMCRKEHVFEVV